MRSCEGLVDSLLYVIKACVNTSDFDSKVCAHTGTHIDIHLHARTHTRAQHTVSTRDHVVTRWQAAVGENGKSTLPVLN
jgi:kynurenine formamidase